jgi:DNA polymerase III epsilon subunit-like protein
MNTESSEQLYCSVDLEFTGFDPSRDQILEIGFAFFRVSEQGFEITEQWSQVFKPSIEVHPKILGLTGITQEELDAAPEFNDHREFLQEKLGNAIILGHNPVMDVKFLEAYGIKLSGKTIDTLELVQFILPTHHSYNLENLVHFFGIKHSIAHRALGDALSTIHVLENLVQVYNQFSPELKAELEAVFRRGEFEWKPILQTNLVSREIINNDSLKHNSTIDSLSPLEISSQLVIVDEQQADHDARLAKGMKQKNEKSVLAVQDSSTVMRLWKDGLVHGVFKFLEQAETSEQLRFCLKIIVWLHTNWQTEVVFDLNISFFGGQFRQFIVGGDVIIKNELVLCVDYVTLQTLSNSEHKQLFTDRKLIVSGIQNFEKYISDGFGTRLSWNSVIYALRMIYNPETNFGNINTKSEVIAALTSTDLFFSLVYMLLHQTFPANDYVSLTNLVNSNSYVFNRLKNAAGTLQEKLVKVVEIEKTPEVTRIINFLTVIFTPDDNRVKWVTLDETNLSFHDQPIDIAIDAGKILKSFGSVQFTETIADKELLSYYVDRLGLHPEQSEFPNEIKHSNFSFKFNLEKISDQEVFDLAVQAERPLVIAFNNQPSVKSFYNDYYAQLKEKSALFAQGYSGGGNKMFRNFSIKEDSILLVTPEFMAKQNYTIPVKSIVFIGQPSVNYHHPYVAALLERWKESFPNLESLLSLAKIFAALKKIKNNDKVLVSFYNFSEQEHEKDFFVDKLR